MEHSKEFLSTLIQGRKSTFTGELAPGEKIPNHVIEEILNLAVWAPTHGLVQSWRFIVFHGEGVASFFRKQQEIYKNTTPSDAFSELKYKKYETKSNVVSHVIAACMVRDPNNRYPEQEDLVAAACAVQNIYLSLHAFGIAGYLSTGHGCYTDEMRRYLGLGRDDKCLGFFQLGYAKTLTGDRHRKRVPAHEKSLWIGS
jgi:nitroreductase